MTLVFDIFCRETTCRSDENEMKIEEKGKINGFLFLCDVVISYFIMKSHDKLSLSFFGSSFDLKETCQRIYSPSARLNLVSSGQDYIVYIKVGHSRH